MRGPQVFSGYWKKPDETAAVFVPADDGGADWFRTGDIVAIDDDGFVRIVDRIKELIITGGFNVAPSEVEEAIRAHADVEDCAVVGLPDEHSRRAGRGRRRAASRRDASTRRPSAPSPATGSPPTRCPQRIVQVDELPRSLIGKVLRREVRNGLLDG